jgi:hypothetical protein
MIRGLIALVSSLKSKTVIDCGVKKELSVEPFILMPTARFLVTPSSPMVVCPKLTIG